MKALLFATSFYLWFTIAHPKAKNWQRKFESLKSYFVKQRKDKIVWDKIVCCCKYHVELDLLVEGLNSLKDGIKGSHVSNACMSICSLWPR
jgi:hypothetical protein